MTKEDEEEILAVGEDEVVILEDDDDDDFDEDTSFSANMDDIVGKDESFSDEEDYTESCCHDDQVLAIQTVMGSDQEIITCKIYQV